MCCSDGSAGPESLDGAGGARSTEKSDIWSWHYAMGWSKRKFAERDIRSQRNWGTWWSKFKGGEDSSPWLPLRLAVELKSLCEVWWQAT